MKFVIKHVLIKKQQSTYFYSASNLYWYDRYNTHLSFVNRFKSLRTYTALLQGHKCQSKILAVRYFGIRVFLGSFRKEL